MKETGQDRNCITGCLKSLLSVFIRVDLCASVANSFLRYSPGKAWPGILGPAEARKAASESARDSWWEESLGVVEASRCGVAACGFVKRQEALPALARRACRGIVQQISFRREAL